MADHRHIGNVGNAVTRLSVVASHHVPNMSGMMRLPW